MLTEVERGMLRPNAEASFRLFNQYKNDEACQDKNILVCKNCSAFGLSNTTVSALDAGYNIWCFDSGSVVHNVKPLPFVLLSQIQPWCLKRRWFANTEVSSACYNL